MDKRYILWLAAVLLLSLPLLGAQDTKKSSSKGKGYLGVQIQDVTSRHEKRFKLPADEGAVVTEVVEDSPAEKAGFKEDDVVLSFAGKDVYDADDLTRFVQRTDPETKVDVVVWRDGAKKTIQVTIGKRKASAFGVFAPGPGGNVMVWSGRASYGLQLNTLNEQLGAYFGVPEKKGVLVESVKEKSAAEKAGFQAGDVIVKVGKEPVAKSSDVLHELADYEEGDKVEFEVYRKGAKKTLTIEVEEGDEEGFHYFFNDMGDHEGMIGSRRIQVFPGDDREMQFEIQEEALQDAKRAIEETREKMDEGHIRIMKRIPRIEVRSGRVTI